MKISGSKKVFIKKNLPMYKSKRLDSVQTRNVGKSKLVSGTLEKYNFY